jgi:hypothetical protein
MPRTGRDKFTVAMLVINFGLLITFLLVAGLGKCPVPDQKIAATAEGKNEIAEYNRCSFGVWGATSALILILLELTILLFVKYYQTNFRFTTPVTSLLVACIGVYAVAILIFHVGAVKGGYCPDPTTQAFFEKLISEFLYFAATIYLIILAAGLLLIEFTGRGGSSTAVIPKPAGDGKTIKSSIRCRYSVQFYIFCLITILLCVGYSLWIMYK